MDGEITPSFYLGVRVHLQLPLIMNVCSSGMDKFPLLLRIGKLCDCRKDDSLNAVITRDIIINMYGRGEGGWGRGGLETTAAFHIQAMKVGEGGEPLELTQLSNPVSVSHS
jgi:hypothetical protein